MRYKNDKQYQICHHQIRFFKLKMHQNPFLAGAPLRTPLGSLRRSPRPPSRLGREIPSPHSRPRSTPSASRTRRLRRLSSQAPSTQNPGYDSVLVKYKSTKYIYFRAKCLGPKLTELLRLCKQGSVASVPVEYPRSYVLTRFLHASFPTSQISSPSGFVQF